VAGGSLETVPPQPTAAEARKTAREVTEVMETSARLSMGKILRCPV
jgi:hypothetical protein